MFVLTNVCIKDNGILQSIIALMLAPESKEDKNETSGKGRYQVSSALEL